MAKLAQFEGKRPLIVTESGSESLYLAARNLPYVEVRDVQGLDPVALVGADYVVVTVDVADGLNGLLRATGRSYLEIDQDGQPKRGVSGRNVDRGTRVRLAADESLRIRVGNAGAVQLVVNGLDLGRMGESGAVVEWRITRR